MDAYLPDWLSQKLSRIKRTLSKPKEYRCRFDKVDTSPRIWPPETIAVSVVIPCYNYGRFLPEAVESVWSQTLQSYEVIIVDDGSNDKDTDLVLRRYEEAALKNPRLRVIRQKNTGLPGARNTGIAVAHGVYVCCLDSDDMLTPTYLEKVVIQLELQADPGIGYSWIQKFGDEDTVYKTERLDLRRILNLNCVSVAAIFRREDWQVSGGFNDSMRGGYEDWEFWLRLAGMGRRGYLVPEPLFKYRKHGRTMLSESGERHDELVDLIRKNNPTLYADNQKVNAVISGYSYARRSPAFANLKQWNDQTKKPPTLLLILDSIIADTTEPQLRRCIERRIKNGWRIVVVTPDSAPYDAEGRMAWLEAATSEIFQLPRFLPREAWGEFLDYAIETRYVSLVLHDDRSFVRKQLRRLQQKYPKLPIERHNTSHELNVRQKMVTYGRTFFDEQQAGSLSSAEVAIPLLISLVNAQSAVDIGCGVGTWLRALMAHGVSDVLGIDGDYMDRSALQIPTDRFLPQDLRQPFALDRRFDVALSLEVAEHLPTECAEGFINSLVRLAPVILFSAAIPFQGGTDHVNEQWPEYWASIFKRHGYIPLDCIRPQIWNDQRVDWWYAQNILVYANEEGLSKNPRLATCREGRSQSQLSLVHPKQYLHTTDPRRRGLRAAKKAFLKRLKRLIRRPLSCRREEI